MTDPSTPALPDVLPDVMTQVRTRPLFVMRLKVAPLQIVGAAPGGFRRIGVIDGGEFAGDRVAGKVLNGASDWQIVRPDGATTLNVRLALETADGALIAMTYQGLRHGPADVMARLDKGLAVDPAAYYFRVATSFETAAPAYAWMNGVIAIGIGHRLADGPVYSVFEVL